MQVQERQLDNYDISVLRLVWGVEEKQSSSPAIIDIFNGLQQEEDNTRCYSTLKYRLRKLMAAGLLDLDQKSDRHRTKVILTEEGHKVLKSLVEKPHTGRGEKPTTEEVSSS
jgi:hypothetical protein